MILKYFETHHWIEWQIIDFIQKFNNSITNKLGFLLTSLASGEVIFGIIIFIYYCLNKKLAKKIAWISSISIVLNSFLKSLFMVKRPFQFDGKENLYKCPSYAKLPLGSSFPSGHSQNSGTVFTLIFKNFKKRYIKVLAILAIIIIPLTRLFLGVHFPIDVVVGLILGIVTALVLNKYYDLLNNKGYLIISLTIIILNIPIIIIRWNNPLNEDLFKALGLFLGLLAGFYFEEKYVNFSNETTNIGYLLRLLIGLVTALMSRFLLKLIFPDINIFHLIRYFIMVFLVVGIVPLSFKKEAKHE